MHPYFEGQKKFSVFSVLQILKWGENVFANIHLNFCGLLEGKGGGEAEIKPVPTCMCMCK